MCYFRVILLTLGTILILSIATAESRRQTSRPRRQPPPPLYLYPGPHPPSRKRPNAPPRRPLRQSPSYHSDLIYNDPESPYRSPHSKPPSLYSQYDELSGSPYSRPHKSKKPSSYHRGPPPSKKYPYYPSATSYKPSRPAQISPSHSPYLKPYNSDTVPKETIATFVNRPSSSFKGTPTLSYNGYSNKPSVSYGPPYPPKPFKSYGVPAKSHDYVEEEYNDDEEMYGSHPHSTAIKNPIIKTSPNFASSHFSFEHGNSAIQYFNDAHNPAGSTNTYSTKFPDVDVLVDPHPMRPTPSPPGPFKVRNRKRPQREDDSQNIVVSTSRPFKSNNVVRHPTPSQYPVVDINGPNFKYPGPELKPSYPQMEVNGAYKIHERYPSVITGPTPNYPSHEVYPTTEVITGNRQNKFSIKEVFPQRGNTEGEVMTGEDQIRNNYDQFLKETFKTPKQTQDYEDHAEATVSPVVHQTPRTRGTNKYRDRQRTSTSNRSKNRVRTTPPPRQYEVHDDPEEREDIPDNHKDFEYIE